MNKLENITKDYVKRITGRERYGDAQRGVAPKSIRHLNREWRMAPAVVSTQGAGRHKKQKGSTSNSVVMINNDLLDISKNAEKLTGDELSFCEVQKGSRIMRLSEQIDIKYAEEMVHPHEQEEAKRQEVEDIEDFINPPEFREVVSKSPVRSERKRLAVSTPEGTEALPDTTPETPRILSQPQVRKVRNVDERFKDAIATVSYRTAVSVSKARVAVQTVGDKLYNHKYYISEGSELRESKNKKPGTKGDYERDYQFVLPSDKIVSSYKHEKALHQEIPAAKALD